MLNIAPPYDICIRDSVGTIMPKLITSISQGRLLILSSCIYSEGKKVNSVQIIFTLQLEGERLQFFSILREFRGQQRNVHINGENGSV